MDGIRLPPRVDLWALVPAQVQAPLPEQFAALHVDNQALQAHIQESTLLLHLAACDFLLKPLAPDRSARAPYP